MYRTASRRASEAMPSPLRSRSMKKQVMRQSGSSRSPFSVLLLASDVGKLRSGSELAPADDLCAVEHQGGVSTPLPDPGLLQFAIPPGHSLVLARFEMERDAPAPSEDPVMFLHETGEGRPGGRGERFGDEGHTRAPGVLMGAALGIHISVGSSGSLEAASRENSGRGPSAAAPDLHRGNVYK